jgi:hypothetical protein
MSQFGGLGLARKVPPHNNGMKLTGSAMLNLPRPPQLIPVLGRR